MSDKCTCCPYGYHIDVDFVSFLQKMDGKTNVATHATTATTATAINTNNNNSSASGSGSTRHLSTKTKTNHTSSGGSSNHHRKHNQQQQQQHEQNTHFQQQQQRSINSDKLQKSMEYVIDEVVRELVVLVESWSGH